MLTFLRAFLLVGFCCYTAKATCPSVSLILCRHTSHCIYIPDLCDGFYDCPDGYDEDSNFCQVWRNFECGDSNALCTRKGISSCVTIEAYCTMTDPACEGNLDPRLCKILEDGRLQDLDDIILEVTTMTPPNSKLNGTSISPYTTESIRYKADNFQKDFNQWLDLTIRHKECPQLYTKIGDQCVSVFVIANLTWQESREFCQAIGGELFTIRPDLSNYVTLLQHLNANQITRDFWIGGTFKNASVGWRWIDDTDIPLGSPVWAVRYSPVCSNRAVTSTVLNVTRYANDGFCYHYKQAPSTPVKGHCTAINYEHYFYATDEDCLVRKSPLCVAPDEHPKQAL